MGRRGKSGAWYAVRERAACAVRTLAVCGGYVEYLYRRRVGMPCNLDDPRTFSEKLRWMQVHYRDARYTALTDKVTVRDFVRERVGEAVLIPCYGVWERAREIDFDALPAQFVLKCNHESGFVAICRDKASFDRRYVCAQLDTRLRINYAHRFNEWHYRDIAPRILAEALLPGVDGEEPRDYKFYCFHGEPGFIQVDHDRHTRHARAIYSPRWEPLPFTLGRYPLAAPTPPPVALPRMLALAAALSRDFPFCRVDLYAVGEQVYFGELTFFPFAGLAPLRPLAENLYWGSRLTLPTR